MLRVLVLALLQLGMLRGSLVLVSADEVQEEELVLAFVVNRHGERTPDADELALSDQQEKIRKMIAIEGLEGLTIAGKRRGFQIGKFIRQRYGSQGHRLLSNIYYPNEIAVRSTDKERTKMTAQVAMASLYPPEIGEQWDDGLGKLWQPVPYTAVPLSEDYLRYYSNCQRFKELMVQAKKNSTNEEFLQYKDLMTLVKQETGKDFSEDPIQFQTLFDLFRSTVSLGLDIPEWAKPLMPKLGEAAKLAYRLYFRTDEMKKIGGGKLETIGLLILKVLGDISLVYNYLNNRELTADSLSPRPVQPGRNVRQIKGVILNDFIQAASDIASGKPVTKRFRMYSGHDFNIGSLMEVTKVIKHEQSIPEYGALFGLELYLSKKTGEYTVVPIYLPRAGDSTLQVLHFSYSENTGHCSLDKFIDKTKEFVLSEKDYYNICNIKTEL